MTNQGPNVSTYKRAIKKGQLLVLKPANSLAALTQEAIDKMPNKKARSLAILYDPEAVPTAYLHPSMDKVDRKVAEKMAAEKDDGELVMAIDTRNHTTGEVYYKNA